MGPLLLATLSASSTDNTVNAQIANLNDSSRRLLSSYQTLSWCDWFNPCPIGYTNLHSDFNPVLDATTSGLKLFNGQPKLKVDFTLPNYYYNVQVSYSQCAAGNDLSLTATAGANGGCDIAYATEVSCVDHCTFDLAPKNGDATAYSYSGELTIRAHLQLTADDPNVNFCNCDCVDSTQNSGYAGEYCEEDVTPPTCTIPGGVEENCECGSVSTGLAIDIASEHGGCKTYDFTAVLPTFDDNSGYYRTSRRDQVNSPTPGAPTAYVANTFESLGALNAFCFDIGTHSIAWQVVDEADDADIDANAQAFCGYTITVTDNSDPYVDCAQCNDDGTAANGAVTFAGDSLSCDCSAAQGDYDLDYSYHKSFGAWGSIYAYDVHDSSVSTDSPQASDFATDFFEESLTYSATDDAAPSGSNDTPNTGSCTIILTVDTTAPTCEGIDLGSEETALVPHPIHADTQINGNYTDAITFNLAAMVVDASVSGLKSGPTLGNLEKDTATTGFAGAGAPPSSGDTFYLNPSDASTTYTATISITDNADNEGSCTWQLVVTNPFPCVWPDCEDRPPQCNNSPLTGTTTYDCDTDNAGCGCGNWAEPTLDSALAFDDVNNVQIFTDDRGIVDSTRTNNYDPSDVLALGDTTITYEACDYHGDQGNADHCATCTFIIKYVDSTAPTFDACPTDDTYNTQTSTYDYDYTVTATDSCVLNTAVTLVGGRTGDTAITRTDDDNDGTVSYDTLTESGTLTLDVGSHGFLWTATDESNNSDTCEWTIVIADNYPPEIECGYGDYGDEYYYVRIDQGQTSEAVAFSATASDTNDGDISSDILYYLGTTEITNAYQFTEGFYTVIAYVDDSSYNSDSCEIYITVAEPYPTVYYRPTLTKADVYIDGSNFKGDLEFAAASSSNNNDQLTGAGPVAQAVGATPQEGNCLISDPICYNLYDFTADFGSDCTGASNGKAYDITATVECQGVDFGLGGQHSEDVCGEADTVDTFTAELVASNYCWQRLADVETDADFITVSKADFDAWQAGIITVTSDQVANFDGVELTTMTKTHHDSSDYNTFGASSYDLVNGALTLGVTIYDSANSNGGSDWAAFTYQENDVPLETTQYVRYSGSVTISNFDFGSRRLLDVDTLRYLQQNGDSLLDEAIVVMMLQNCDESNVEWESTLVGAIGKYLRIDTARVNVQIDPTSEGYCLAEATISQADCAGNVDILSLIEYLENGILDSFSALHTYVAQDLPVDVAFDHTVFFVAQQPSTIYESASIESGSVSTTSQSSSGLAWYYYTITGLFIGSAMVAAAYKLFGASKSSNNEAKHTQLSPERRYSIADLIAQTDRRSSVDVNNVRLHNAL